MPAGTARPRKTATADAASTPETIEAEIVDETPADPAADEAQTETGDAAPKPPGTLDYLRSTFDAMRKGLNSEWGAKLDAAKDELADLINAKTTADLDESETVDVVELRAEVAALSENRVTPVAFGDLREQFTTWQTDVAQSFKVITDAIDNLALTGTVSGANPPRPAAVATPGVPLVYGQVLELMRKVEEIGKNGEADFGQGKQRVQYSFRGVDDAMNAVGSAMRSVGLIYETQVLDTHYETTTVDRIYNGQKEGTTVWTTTHVTMRYTFISPLDGSRHSVEGLGEGRDNADKGTPKALAGAMKIALLHGLCIPVKGMNVDSETAHPVIETNTRSGDYSPPVGQGRGPATNAAVVPELDADQEPAQMTEREAYAAASTLLTNAKNSRDQVQLRAVWNEAVSLGVTAMLLDGSSLSAHIAALKNTLPERAA